MIVPIRSIYENESRIINIFEKSDTVESILEKATKLFGVKGIIMARGMDLRRFSQRGRLDFKKLNLDGIGRLVFIPRVRVHDRERQLRKIRENLSRLDPGQKRRDQAAFEIVRIRRLQHGNHIKLANALQKKRSNRYATVIQKAIRKALQKKRSNRYATVIQKAIRKAYPDLGKPRPR